MLCASPALKWMPLVAVKLTMNNVQEADVTSGRLTVSLENVYT